MRAGSAAGAAEKADLAMPGDTLPDRHGLAVQMGVAGRDAVAVVDLDDLAVIVTISGIGHDAGRGRVDRGHVGRPQIDTGVIGRMAVDRIAAHAERAAELIALERRRYRQRLDQIAQCRGLFRAHRRRGLAGGRRDKRAAQTALDPELGKHVFYIHPGRGEHALDLRKGAAIDRGDCGCSGHRRGGRPGRLGGRRAGHDDRNLAGLFGGWRRRQDRRGRGSHCGRGRSSRSSFGDGP